MLLDASCAALPAAALARDGRPEIRRPVSCGSGVTADLRLRAQDGRIRARFEVEHEPRGHRGTSCSSHERRIAWRGHRASSFEVERSLPDFPGSDARERARDRSPAASCVRLPGVLPEVSDGGNGAQGGYG